MAWGSVLISDHAFWRPECGMAARWRELVGFLVDLGPLEVIYAGAEVAEFERLATRFAAADTPAEVHCESLPPGLAPGRVASRLSALVAEHAPERVVVLAAELAWVADLVPAEIPVILDAPGPLSADAEARVIAAARSFDRVVLDDADALRRCNAVLGADRCGFCPQPAVPVDPLPPLRDVVARIGLYFGAAPADSGAVRWLHRVWSDPVLAAVRGGIEIVVGGDGVGDLRRACADFRFVGPVDRAQPFFAAVDIVVAPPGAPPPVEALAHGRPVLATPETLRPLREILGPACDVADGAPGFAVALARLIGDAARRRHLREVGVAVARARLTPELCFRALRDAPSGLRPPPGGAVSRPVLPSFAEGLAHQRAGRLALAEATFRRVLVQTPEHADALHALGMLAMRRGDAAAAVALFARAAAQRTDRPMWWNALAAAHVALGRFAEAEVAADRAVALRPDFQGALLNRARARRGLGRAEAAEADCTAALAIGGEVADIRHERGLARLARNDRAGAEGDLRAALTQRPHRLEWAADLARLHHDGDAADIRPRVALVSETGGLPAAWEPVWALPGIAVVAATPADTPPDCDLVVTADAAFASRAAAAGREVWLCGAAPADTPRLLTFPIPAGQGWAIADMSASLAVWARAWSARAAAMKPIADPAAEGYTPPDVKTPHRPSAR